MEPFEKKKEKAIKIGRTIEKITPRLPWKCTCMVKALSACLMLYIRRIPHRLFIGVRRDKDGIIQAHAWLCFGHVVITGGKEYDTYNKMSSIE